MQLIQKGIYRNPIPDGNLLKPTLCNGGLSLCCAWLPSAFDYGLPVDSLWEIDLPKEVLQEMKSVEDRQVQVNERTGRSPQPWMKPNQDSLATATKARSS